MHKKWNVQKKYDPSLDVVLSLLENRGVTSKEQIDEFLNPKPFSAYLEQFPQDFKKGIKSSKELILEFVAKKQPILIYGDYDTDGVCATAILYNTIFEVLGHKQCLYFIPNRFEHGYGISEKGLVSAHKQLQERFGEIESALMISVDTGITAVDEVVQAQKMGFKVIITDHHQKPDPVPAADVILWSDKVVGAGISWLLSKSLGLSNFELIELMALATVTDLQELTGFNRCVVKKGLEAFNSSTCLGISKLLEACGKTKEITVYDLGWVLGPRINALGRMENASLGVELLTSTNVARAEEIAHMLGQTNVRRQDETEKMYDLANIESGDGNLLFSSNKDYHEGIIGLVASRLVQKHYKPAIVIALDEENGLGKGSVRSVPGINIIEVLRKFDSLFEKLGGHPMAAGFSIRTENIEKLKTELTKYMNENFTPDFFVPFLDIDMEIPLNIVDLNLFTQISRLEPYGVSNPEPIFCAYNLKVADFSYVGKDARHLSIKFFNAEKYYKAIYFNADKLNLNIDPAANISAAFTLSKNEWNGRVTIDLIIRDLLLK